MKAKHRATGKKVAIKFIKNDFKDICQCKSIFRELYLLRKFGNSIFTTTLFETIIASPDQRSLKDAVGIFIVMKLEHSDLKEIFK